MCLHEGSICLLLPLWGVVLGSFELVQHLLGLCEHLRGFCCFSLYEGVQQVLRRLRLGGVRKAVHSFLIFVVQGQEDLLSILLDVLSLVTIDVNGFFFACPAPS